MNKPNDGGRGVKGSEKNKAEQQQLKPKPLRTGPRATPRGALGLGRRLEGSKQGERAAHLVEKRKKKKEVKVEEESVL